jgi:hypothetical protein
MEWYYWVIVILMIIMLAPFIFFIGLVGIIRMIVGGGESYAGQRSFDSYANYYRNIYNAVYSKY